MKARNTKALADLYRRKAREAADPRIAQLLTEIADEYERQDKGPDGGAQPVVPGFE